MIVAIGSDHAGVSLKKTIIDTFSDIEFKDLGTKNYDILIVPPKYDKSVPLVIKDALKGISKKPLGIYYKVKKSQDTKQGYVVEPDKIFLVLFS